MDVNDNNLAYLEAIHNFVEVSAGCWGLWAALKHWEPALGSSPRMLGLSSPSPWQWGQLGLSLPTPVSFCLVSAPSLYCLYAASYVPLRLSLTVRFCSFLSLCLSLSLPLSAVIIQ